MVAEPYIAWVRTEGPRRHLPDGIVNSCVQYARVLLERDLPVIYDDKHLAVHLDIPLRTLWAAMRKPELFYREFRIRKRSGGFRKISAPKPTLRASQRWILDSILARVRLSVNCTGFRRGVSIADNATPHVGAPVVLNMDIKEFFPSVRDNRVYRIYRDLGYSRRVSFALTRVCTYSGRLPQGAPTSPALANIACRRLDVRLRALARSASAAYTRYADDMTFSGDDGICRLIRKIARVVRAEGFRVNWPKTLVMRRGRSQLVTGLTVNDKVSIPRRRRRRIRQIVHHCEKWGPHDHRRRTGHTRRNLRDHLYGWAYYIKALHWEEGQGLLGQLDRIDWEA